MIRLSLKQTKRQSGQIVGGQCPRQGRVTLEAPVLWSCPSSPHPPLQLWLIRSEMRIFQGWTFWWFIFKNTILVTGFSQVPGILPATWKELNKCPTNESFFLVVDFLLPFSKFNLSFYPICFLFIHTILHGHLLVFFFFSFFLAGRGILITEMESYNTRHSAAFLR